MPLFEQFNRVSTVKEGVDLGSMEFRKLRDFVGRDIYVDGFFFTHSKYGEQVVVVGNGYKINMPAKAVDDFKKISGNKELHEAVLNGHLMITSITIKALAKGDAVNYIYKDC